MAEMLMDVAAQPVGEQTKVIDRDQPDVPAERAELVQKWLKRVEGAKSHWDKKFKKMRSDMKFVRGKQWPRGSEDAYVCNVTLRHIQQRVAAIYAKNPTFTAKRKPRLDFAIWSGDPQELMMARASLASGVPDPMAVELLADVEQGMQHRRMMDRIGKSLEIVFSHQLGEQNPRFKPEMKQLARRVKTLGVGYIELGYQRVMGEGYAEKQMKIADDSRRLAELERLAADVADGQVFDGQAQIEELKVGLASLQAEKDLILREGLTVDFPRVSEIIVDPDCTQLKGFRDAKWIAREYAYTPEEVRATWKKQVGVQFDPAKPEAKKAKNGDKGACRVYCVYDLVLKVHYIVCEGYPDFLQEPGPMPVWFEQGHPFFTLSFNDIEDDEDPYPPSDIDVIRHSASEINRASEARREHRKSNRPAWVSAKGLFTKDDRLKLSDHESGELLELDAISATDDRKIADKLMAKPVQSVDEAMYETDTAYQDMLRATGDQEANLGPTGGDTATEATIAENSRVTSLQSEIDDIDEFLTDVARAASQILLREMDAATVTRIAGRGAVWPTLNKEDVADELYLEIQAGSSGRPNRALKIANKERMLPYLVQIPGVNPAWLFKSLARELEEDDEEAYIQGMPSITAMNAMTQPSTGNPDSDPNAQGGEGGNNQPQGPGKEQGPQPEMPAPLPLPRRVGGAGIV